MHRLTAKTRITFGLACLVVSVLLVAMLLGLVPDRASAVMDGRARICEAMGINTSVFISANGTSPANLAQVRTTLEAISDRNPDVASIGLRTAENRLLIQVGAHAEHWIADVEDRRSTADQIKVPLRSGEETWGLIEVRFNPLQRAGMRGMFDNHWLRLVTFVTCSCFVSFLFYLRKMLQHLDPSQAVPGRVRSALDNLAEGLLVLDRQGRIMLANDAFIQMMRCEAHQLLGQKASELLTNQTSGPSCLKFRYVV